MRNYTIEQIKQQTYGGMSSKHKARPEQCHEAVRDSHGFFRTKQCSRKLGFGRGGLFCKQHAKKYPSEEV